MDGDLGVNMDLATGSYESHAAEFKVLLPWLRMNRTQVIRIIAEQI